MLNQPQPPRAGKQKRKLTGDGAGIPHEHAGRFIRATAGVELPEEGHYAAGIAFLDRDIATSGQQEQAIAKIVREEGLEVLAWRVVPTNPDGLGLQALASMRARPFRRAGESACRHRSWTRKTAHPPAASDTVSIYFVLSARTITYKHTPAPWLEPLLPGSFGRAPEAGIAIVHSASPPTRSRAGRWLMVPPTGPQRRDQHHQGNRNWLSAREGRLSSNCSAEFRSRCCRQLPRATPVRHVRRCLETAAPVGRSMPCHLR